MSGENLGPSFMAYKSAAASQGAVDEMEAFARAGAQDKPNPVAPATAPQDGVVDTAKGIVKDIGGGIVETPRAIVKGVRDAYANLFNMGDELSGWLEQKSAGTPLKFMNAGVRFDKEGVHWMSPEEAKKIDPLKTGDLFPDLNAPATVTGGLIKGVAQFLTGMKGAGKLAKAAGIPELTGGAGYALAAGKGALANFTAFDPHQQRLSNLIQKFPSLQNPVTEYLASDPNDNAAEGRFKNALEGVGLGVLTDGFFKGVKILNSAIRAKTATQAAVEKVVQPAATSEEIDQLLSGKPPEPGGIPEPPPVIVRPGSQASEKLAAAAQRTSAIAPDDVVGRMVAPLEPIDSSAIGRDMTPPKTFINFARIDTGEDVQRAMQGLADKIPLNADTAKEGVRSFDQMKLDAAHTNAWDSLVARRAGEPLGDAQMLAARQLWASATDKVSQLAQEAATNPSEANLFAFRKMLATHSVIQNEVLGARASIARAQASMRIPVGSSAERLRELQFSLEASGGTDVARELARAVDGMAKAGLIHDLSATVEKGAGARTLDAAKEAWTLGLLSSPKTHLRNIVSNTAFVPTQIAERWMAGKFAGFLGDETSVQAGEAAAQYYGTTQAAKDMFRYYGKLLQTRILQTSDAFAVSTGQAPLSDLEQSMAAGDAARASNPIFATGLRGTEKLDLPARAISSEALRIPEDSWLGKGVDALGSTYGLTTNALTAEDNFYKVLAYRGETHAQAFRQARQELAQGLIDEKGIPDRMAELISSPPENIRLAAHDQALYQTFNQSPGWFGQMLLKAKHNSLFAHILIPFARTTSNLQRASFERTPLAFLVGQWRADLMAGGARRDLALARVSLGSMATLAVIDATTSGQITGRGPPDPGQRQAMAREGWKPYSWNIGGRWFTYNGISPVGDQIGMAADIAEIAKYGHEELIDGKDMENVVLAGIAAVAGNVMNKSYLSGFSSAVDALNDPNGGAAQWARQMAGSVIPTGVAALARSQDPNVRAVNSMMDAIRSRIPGMSESLPARHDLWGEPMRIDSGLGKPFDALSPVFSQKPTPEPIDQEILRLGADISMPPSSTSFNGASVNLRQRPDIYERYVELAGNELKHPAWRLGAKDYLNAVVSGNHPMSAVYRLRSDGPDGGKDVFIRETIQQYRELARRQLLKEYPDLALDVSVKREHQRALRMPVIN
jgi:hypothetical protein